MLNRSPGQKTRKGSISATQPQTPTVRSSFSPATARYEDDGIASSTSHSKTSTSQSSAKHAPNTKKQPPVPKTDQHTPRSHQYAPRSQFMELASSSAKDLYRDRKGSFSILFMFFFVFLLMVGIHYAINIDGKGAPVVAVDSSVVLYSEVREQLAASGLKTVDDQNTGAATVTVKQTEQGVVVLVDAKRNSQWLQVAAAVERAGYKTSDYVVIDTIGDPVIDTLRNSLAGVSCIGLMAITFMGTSVPLTRMRENGTLRLLGTTPANKLTFILAQTPARLIFGVFVILTIFITSLLLGYTQAAQLFRLLGTMTLGLAMLFALAYLLASRSRKPDTINNISATLPMLVLFASGSVLPPRMFPEPVTWALDCLPTTWYVRAAAADLAGDATSTEHIWLYWTLMLTTPITAAALATRLFLWDDQEHQ